MFMLRVWPVLQKKQQQQQQQHTCITSAVTPQQQTKSDCNFFHCSESDLFKNFALIIQNMTNLKIDFVHCVIYI